MALLNIENLSVIYRTRRGCLKALDQVGLVLPHGRCLGLVGESGSGKSTIGLATLGLLPNNAEVVSGRILLEGLDLLQLPAEGMQAVRWKKIAMVFQGAMNSLNPIQRVEKQIIEAIRTHAPQTSLEAAAARVSELFSQVGIADARRRDYPHQFSGGMRQRVVIAMALACRPAMIIADEPTTALDVIVQRQILRLLRQLRDEAGMSILFISHDIAVVAEVCDDIGVLYAGQLVEMGSRQEVLDTPAHPYTQSLLNAYTGLADGRVHPGPPAGRAPDLVRPPEGCRFGGQCPDAETSCTAQPPVWQDLSPTHRVRCGRCCGSPSAPGQRVE
jgi:peptide/nickel transport system ATP-binding protein